MKRFLFVVFIFSSLLFAQEQLQNGGMEYWTGGLPDYWTSSSGITVSQEASIVHSGNYSAKIVKTSTVTEQINQTFIPAPSTRYYFSFWIYTDTHIRARFWLRWYSGGSNIRSDGSSYSSPSNPNTWQNVVIDTVSPTSVDSVQCQVRFYNVAWGDSITSATAYVDDISCIQQSANQLPEIQNITLNPYAPYPDSPVVVSATIYDPDGSISADSLYYSIDGGAYNGMIHSNINGNIYSYNLPSLPELSKVNYYIVAVDNEGAKRTTSTKTYKVYYPTNDTLNNKGMELWISSDNPQYWSVENPSYVSATQSTDFVLEGSYSCKLSRLQVQNSGISQKIKVNPRDTIVVFSNIYDNDPDVSGRMWFRMIFWDGTTSNVYSSYTIDSNQWQEFPETLILPDEIDSLTVLFRVYTQSGTTGDSLGDIYVDKISLRSISGIPEEKEDLRFDSYIVTNGVFSYNTGKSNIIARLFDISGRTIDEKFFPDGQVRLDLKDKKSGIYFVNTGGKFIRIINLNIK